MENSSTTFEILGKIPGIENLSYLELGTGMGYNFENIPCKEKTSVDIIPGRATFAEFTDAFFERIPKEMMFDIIFVDACHHFDFVLKDYNNSILHCKKFLFMHDLVPPLASYTDWKYCWDGYKILTYILENTKMKPLIWNEEFSMGLSLFTKPFEELVIPHSYRDVTFSYFKDVLKKNEHLLKSKKEIIDFIIKEM